MLLGSHQSNPSNLLSISFLVGFPIWAHLFTIPIIVFFHSWTRQAEGSRPLGSIILYGYCGLQLPFYKRPLCSFLYARLKNGTYYAVAMSVRPSVCPSVRLSVRPSVRPRFPDFSSTCFEISIWNLVYAFSRWHDMSSLSCITIGSLWSSLQPKVGQTYFLQSWPHKSR